MTFSNRPPAAEERDVDLPAPSANADADRELGATWTPRLRRLGAVWLVVALIEGLLYFFLYRPGELRDLFTTPALLVLAGGAFQSWRVVRRRAHADRRQGDRRHARRR